MSFPRYPEYRDSGVEWLGGVPGHWELVRYKNVFCEKSSIAGISHPPGSISFGRVIFKDDEFLHEPTKASYQEVLSGEFLINPINLNYDLKSLRTALSEIDTCVSPAYIVLKAKAESDKNYLKHQLHVFDLFHMKTLGAGVRQTITFSDIGVCFTCLPPLSEQAQIAAFLDRETAKIDALVAEQRRLMALLKEKRQAVISDAVTRGLNPHAPMKPSGNKWLGNVPEHWIVCCLKHIKAEVKNAFVDGPFGSNLKSEHFIDDGDVYVIESNFATQGRIDTESLKTISNEHFATINRSETRGGDIVIAKIGAQYGKASILPALDRPAVVSGNSLKLTINQKSCDVKFVNWHLANLKELGVMEDIVNATAQPALSLGEMNNLPMLVPPRTEQEAIVQFLNEKLGEFDTLTTEAQRAIDLLQERRTALISAAVTGQIDVRGAMQ